MADDLEVLFPKGMDVTVRGETLTVMPFYFGQFPEAMKRIQPLMPLLRDSGLMQVKTEGGDLSATFSEDWVSKLPQVLADGGEMVIHLLVFAVKKKRDWFDQVPMDEGIDLAQAVFKVNADFFQKRVLPKLGLVEVSPAETSSQAITKDGQAESSEASSRPDTVLETSAATP